MLVSWGPGRSSLEGEMPQMSGWQSSSSELITPSIPLSISDRWRREQLGVRWLLRVASLMIRLHLLHAEIGDTYEWAHFLCKSLFVGVEVCQYVPSAHGAGASIPLLMFCTPWKAYKASSYLGFWSENLEARSCNRSHPCLLRFYPLYLPLPSFSPSGIRDLWRACSPRLWVCINNNASCQRE